MVKITAYVTGIFFAGKKINDLSLGVLANGLMVLTASFSLLRYTYNQKSLQAQRDTLKRWSALAPELENPSIDKKSAESLRARERRQFIATGLIGLEQFKQQGIAIDSFLIPEVEYYLEQSTKDKISDVVRIHEVTRILKENLNIAGQFSLQQIRMAAQCLVVEAQRYRTKKIMRCITMLQNGSLSFYGTRKEIDALLQKKAEAIQIQLNSRYSVLRLYKMLSRVDLVQYPPEHPIRRILNLDSSLLDAIRGGNIDEKTARQALHAALGL